MVSSADMAVGLRIPRRNPFSDPGSTNVIPSGSPPLEEISQLADGGVAVDDLAETDVESILRLIGRAAEELPVAVLIVANEENGTPLVDNGLRREDGPIPALLERPRAIV